MKREIRAFLVVLLLIPVSIYGQKTRTRYGVWITPTGNNYITINGLGVGLAPVAGRKGTLTINGLNVDLLPVTVVLWPKSFFVTMLNPLFGPGNMDLFDPDNRTRISGVSISPGLVGVAMNGVSFNFISCAGDSRGLEISLWSNTNHTFSGMQLSGWGNIATKGKGFQLGLFNSCDSCNVVQIGLLNRIGNRVLPLINFKLKNKKTSQEVSGKNQSSELRNQRVNRKRKKAIKVPSNAS